MVGSLVAWLVGWLVGQEMTTTRVALATNVAKQVLRLGMIQDAMVESQGLLIGIPEKLMSSWWARGGFWRLVTCKTDRSVTF